MKKQRKLLSATSSNQRSTGSSNFAKVRIEIITEARHLEKPLIWGSGNTLKQAYAAGNSKKGQPMQKRTRQRNPSTHADKTGKSNPPAENTGKTPTQINPSVSENPLKRKSQRGRYNPWRTAFSCGSCSNYTRCLGRNTTHSKRGWLSCNKQQHRGVRQSCRSTKTPAGDPQQYQRATIRFYHSNCRYTYD